MKTRWAARDGGDRPRSFSSPARPRATTRRRTHPAAARRLRSGYLPRSGPQLELVRGGLVREQPALHVDKVAVGGVREPADTVCRHHAMAGNDDRQAVVASRLSDIPPFGAEFARDLSIISSTPARDNSP